MPSTPIYGLPFEQTPTDEPGHSLHGGQAGTDPILAEAVEAELARIDAAAQQVAFGLLENGAAEVTTDQGSIVDSETVLTGLSVTVDVADGRRVWVSGHISMYTATPPGNFELRLQRDGAGISECGRQAYGSGATQVVGFEVAKLDNPGAGSHTYRLVAIRVSSGGGAGTSRAHTGDPAYIYVFDAGPI